MSVNPVFHDKLKHIQIRYHFIRDMVQKGVVELHYIPTDDQTIDVLTKPLPRVKFEYFRRRLGVEECWNILYSSEGNNVFVLCWKLSTILCKRVNI